MSDKDDYTIWRIDLSTGTASVWKEIRGTEYDAVKEIRKTNGFAKRLNYDSAYIYRRKEACVEALYIPVLREMTSSEQLC